jgi:hypothetical protein
MKNLKKFETKAVKNQNTVKGGSNGKGTRNATSSVAKNANTFDLL